jgi:RimJ/RimL family protein N-acetyltransferase
MEYFKTPYSDTELTIRDIEEADVPAIVDYWYTSDPAYLRSIGVEVAKIAARPREEMERRFLSSIPRPGSETDHPTFVVASGDEVIAYTNLNIKSADEAYTHVHILKEELRSKGLASFLFLPMIRLFFSRFPIEKVVFQASPENEKVNGLIQRFGLMPQKVYLSNPDGMARAGEFNVYEITRQLVESFKTP